MRADISPELRALGGLTTPISRSATPVQNPYTDPSLQESEADRSFSQGTLLQAQQKRVRSNANDTVIAQREREIEDIAQGIIELANIFQELNTMVIDQGTMLDRIDYNVERMAVDVKAANKELTIATGYQKKSVKRKVILLLLILVAGMFILLSLKIGRRGRSAATPEPAPEMPNPPAPPAMVPRSELDPLISRLSSLRSRREWHRRKRRLWSDAGEGRVIL